jgi:hypothetical protein
MFILILNEIFEYIAYFITLDDYKHMVVYYQSTVPFTWKVKLLGFFCTHKMKAILFAIIESMAIFLC